MNDINETNILFARLQRGIKGATYGTDILLVNDTPEEFITKILTDKQ